MRYYISIHKYIFLLNSLSHVEISISLNNNFFYPPANIKRHMQINSCVKMICLHKWNWYCVALNAYQILSSNLKLRHVFVNRPQRALCATVFFFDIKCWGCLWCKSQSRYEHGKLRMHTLKPVFVSHSHYVAFKIFFFFLRFSCWVEHFMFNKQPHTVHIHLHTYILNIIQRF